VAINKILKPALIAAGISAQGGVLWARPAPVTTYSPAVENAGPTAPIL
jgi:fatty-acyl-CoA synthase